MTSPRPPASRALEITLCSRLFAVLILVVLIMRASEALRFPILHGEDGSILFAGFYDGSIGRIFDPMSGYMSLVPRALAYALCHLPATWVPHVFAIAALLMAWWAMLALRSLLRRATRDALFASLGTLVIVVASPGNFALLTTLTYGLWHLLVVLTVLVLDDRRYRPVTHLARALLGAALIWSHPLAWLIVPFVLRRAFRARSRGWPGRVEDWGLTLAAMGYVYSNLGGAAGELHFAHVAAALVPYVLERVLWETFAGLGINLAGSADVVTLTFISTLALLGLFVLVRHLLPRVSIDFKALCYGTAYSVVALTACALLLRGHEVEPTDVFGQRYCYVQRVFTLLLLLALLRLAVPRAWAMIVVCVVLIAYASTFRQKNALHDVSHDQHYALVRYLQRVEAQEAELGSRAAVEVSLHRRQGWPIRFVH